MHKMRGSFAGISTIDVVLDQGHYNLKSLVTGENELTALVSRKDMVGLLARHSPTGVVPVWLHDAMMRGALILHDEEAWFVLCSGLSYVSCSDAIWIQGC